MEHTGRMNGIYILFCQNSFLMFFKGIGQLSVHADWKSYGKVFFNRVRMPSIINNGALVLGNYESHEISTPPSEERNYVSLVYAAILLYLLRDMITRAQLRLS
jgi:hypothetical protein